MTEEPEYRVPDYIGILTGWRAWRIGDSGGGWVLRGLFADVEWPPREEMRATCYEQLRLSPLGMSVHTAPGVGCTCGIHALKRTNDFAFRERLFYTSLEEVVAFGHVSLWGRVIEGSRGFRVEIAYPRDLIIVSRTARTVRRCEILARELAKAYGVDVSVGRWL